MNRHDYSRFAHVGIQPYQLRELRRIAMRLQRYSELECCGIERWDAKAGMRLASWTDADQSRVDRLEAKALREAEVIAKSCGLSVYRQSDPRGLQLYLYDASAITSPIDTCYPQVGLGVPQ